MATRAANADSDSDSDGDVAVLRRYATKASRALAARGAATSHGAHAVGSIREAEHDGHRIVVRTHYLVEVDGRPLDAMLSVDIDGQVTCHAIPAYSYPSAVDIVRRLIDLFPDDFPKPGDRERARRSTRTPGAGDPRSHGAPAPARQTAAAKGSAPTRQATGSARKAPRK